MGVTGEPDQVRGRPLAFAPSSYAGAADAIGVEGLFAAGLAVIAAANIVLFFYLVERTSVRVPVYDMTEWLRFYADHASTGDWWGYLWSPHNEHRIVWSRILLLTDLRLFHGGGTAFVIFGTLLLTLSAATISAEIIRSPLSASLKALAVPVAILLLMPAEITVVIGMPANGVFLHTTAFATTAIILLNGSGRSYSAISWLRTFAAIVCGCLAAFGVSGGLLIWPVLVWSAWREKLSWSAVTLIAALGSVFVALYVRGMPSTGIQISLGSMPFIEIIDYAIRFLGLPWSHLHELVWPSRLLGLLLLVAGIYLLVVDSLWSSMMRLQRIGLALIFFTLLLAAAAAAARSNQTEQGPMPIRYSTMVIPLHVGFLLYALPYLQRIWKGTQRRTLQWLTLGLAIVWLGSQDVVGRFAAEVTDKYNTYWGRFAAGEWDPAMLRYVYPDRAQAEANFAYLSKIGLIGDAHARSQ